MRIIVYGIVFDLLSGLDAIMSLRIVDKLRRVGAVSRDEAVMPEAANLNLQEIGWLQYLAGFLSTIKKTKDGRYCIRGIAKTLNLLLVCVHSYVG
ncbi:MAG: hypothetical protein H3Z53_05515 [archaeon]|nr:hypothetical protein [archaeon]